MRDQLKKAIEQKGYSYKELTEMTGLAVGTISKVMSTDKPVKFNAIISLIRCLTPDHEREMIVEYYDTEDRKPEVLQDLLEYLMTHREFDLLTKVIEECKGHNNKETRQWGSYYDMLQKYKRKKITVDDMLNYINNTNVTCKNLFVLTKLLELNAYYKMMNYNVIANKVNSVVELVNNMKCGYLKHSFTARISEMVAANELKINKNVIKSRKHALAVIESKIGDFFTGFSYYTLAVSYIYENVSEMDKYFRLSLETFSKCYTPEDYENIKNEINKIISIAYNDFNSKVDLSSGDPLDMYILGKSKNDIAYLFGCLAQFVKEGNLFLAELPKLELCKLGINKALLENMAS